MRRTVCLLGALLIAGHPSIAQPGDAIPEYRIGPRDVLGIEVVEDPSLSTEGEVAGDGTIRLPVLGEVPVAGLTAAAAASRIRQALEERLLQRATVTVRIREYLSRPISVLGAVARPGPLSVSGRLTLAEALNEAGGASGENNGELLVLRRAENGLRDELRIDLARLLSGTDPTVNVPIFSGDVVRVPQVGRVTLLFIGEVAKPGEIEFKSNERATLLYALARAGGLTDRASKKIRIKRRRPDGSQQEIRVDYKAVLEGEVPDPQLLDGDLILVKEAFF